MVILVNGQPAALKKDFSIDLTAENPQFKDAGEYSFNIEFPLDRCYVNQQIFGVSGRNDEDWGERCYSAVIEAGNYTSNGCLLVVGASDESIKCQFLAGRSEAYAKFKLEEKYINELDLGEWGDDPEVPLSAIDNLPSVALPWVLDSSGSIQNITLPGGHSGTIGNSGGMSGTHPSAIVGLSARRSQMPYMLYLAKKIAQQIGFDTEFTQWEHSPQKWLLCCNTLPAAWDIKKFCRALPHWTVKDFFDELGYIVGGVFNFDFVTSKIYFKVYAEEDPIEIEDVVDEFEVEMSTDDVEYTGTDMISYADRGDENWKLQSCDWLIKDAEVVEYPDFNSLKNYCQTNLDNYTSDGRPASWGLPFGIGRVYYAADIDSYFAMKIVSKVKEGNVYRFRTHMCMIDNFGARNFSDSDDVKSRERKILPVNIDEAGEYGWTIFLNPNAYSEEYYDPDEDMTQPYALRNIKRGKPGDKAQYFDKIYVGYWMADVFNMENFHAPVVDKVEIWDGWNLSTNDVGLRLRTGRSRAQGYRIDGKCKYTFSFLADKRPSVERLFYINGHLYVCAKLTSTIYEEGMSRLHKGEFYRVL